MHDIIILRVVVRLLLPLILLYGLYILFHGEVSPGGGFQAGIIFAVAFIAYSLVNDLTSLQKILPIILIKFLAAFGILIYAGVGIAAMLKGGRFLGYSVFNILPVEGQKLGIMLVEAGVGLTVFSIVILIFYSFGERSSDDAG